MLNSSLLYSLFDLDILVSVNSVIAVVISPSHYCLQICEVTFSLKRGLSKTSDQVWCGVGLTGQMFPKYKHMVPQHKDLIKVCTLTIHTKIYFCGLDLPRCSIHSWEIWSISTVIASPSCSTFMILISCSATHLLLCCEIWWLWGPLKYRELNALMQKLGSEIWGKRPPGGL